MHASTQNRFARWRCALALPLLLATASPFGAIAQAAESGGDIAWATDKLELDFLSADRLAWERELVIIADRETDLAQFQQQLTPPVEAGQPPPLPATAQRSNALALGAWGVPRSSVWETSLGGPTSADTVLGAEASVRVTTDAGNLLGSSPQVLNLGVQRRNPIVTDPRVRGSSVGALAASGSYWVPARIDLDTMLSKLDSRIVQKTTVVPGPYTALYGPGLKFIDVDLLTSPRFQDGFEAYGQSIVDFRSNGEQWHGRQNLWGGDDGWGFRAGYGHRTGNDYTTGAGTLVPSSYKSRDVDFVFGGSLSRESNIEVRYLRLDQTEVELPGQAFDIDFLYTDAYEVELRSADRDWCDWLESSVWYNRTVLEGDAQRPGKEATFPVLDDLFIDYLGFTDVDSMSTGGRAAATWGNEDDGSFTAGVDLRYLKQQLNEFSSGDQGLPFENANSPIPKSHWSNPGVFAEARSPVGDQIFVRFGGRADWVSSNIDEDEANLQMLGIRQPQRSASEILGTSDFDRDDVLGMGFIGVDGAADEGWVPGVSLGYAERAPNLTERYAIEPFMFLLQNGLNTITGDPLLDKERAIQIDLRATQQAEYYRNQIRVFQIWNHDFITFENIGVVTGPPLGEVVQVQLKYRNTRLATFWGAEGISDLQLTDRVSAFGNLKYVQGTDQAIDEPLPSILPIESRIGLRYGDPQRARQRWGIEGYARLADNQARVATSLFESTTPGFTTWNLRSFWRPNNSLMLTAGAENFTDKAFREHLDFRSLDGGIQVLQPGASLYVSAELTY